MNLLTYTDGRYMDLKSTCYDGTEIVTTWPEEERFHIQANRPPPLAQLEQADYHRETVRRHLLKLMMEQAA